MSEHSAHKKNGGSKTLISHSIFCLHFLRLLFLLLIFIVVVIFLLVLLVVRCFLAVVLFFLFRLLDFTQILPFLGESVSLSFVVSDNDVIEDGPRFHLPQIEAKEAK